MCTELNHDDFDGTQRSLVTLYLDGDPSKLVFIDYKLGERHEYAPELCCCPVDLVATLEPLGYTLKTEDGMDYEVTPNSKDVL